MTMTVLLLLTVLARTPAAPPPASAPAPARHPQPASAPTLPRVPQLPTAPRAVGFGSETTDTTFAVRRGQRLTVDNFAGDVSVKTWLRDAIHLEASHTRRVRVEIQSQPGQVRIETLGRMGPGRADMELVVPTWMPIQIDGVHTEISVEGSKSEVRAQTVDGDIEVTGGTGLLLLSSVEGEVRVVGARGRVQASSINQRVRLSGVVGDISAESVNGDVVLVRPDSKSVEASTINGGVFFDGLTRAGGVYTLSTHNGGILVGLPDKPDVSVSVSTYDGDFSTFLPVEIVDRRRGKPISFVLGSGGAQLDLESFQGSIRLERLGEALSKAWEQLREGESDVEAERAALDAARAAREKAREVRRELREMKIKLKRSDKDATPEPEPDPEDEQDR